MSQIVGRKKPFIDQTDLTPPGNNNFHTSVERTDHHDNAGVQVVLYSGALHLMVEVVGGGVTYVGEAAPGTATADSVWRIRRVTELAGDTEQVWAEIGPVGFERRATFEHAWDDRASLTYT
jgi:hypothetical protein